VDPLEDIEDHDAQGVGPAFCIGDGNNLVGLRKNDKKISIPALVVIDQH